MDWKPGIEQAVERGAAALDKYDPTWAFEVDLDNLEMDDCEQCILGQAIGNYIEGLHAVIPNYNTRSVNTSIDYGFDLCNARADDDGWFYLEECWVKAVKDRLNEGVVID